MNLFQKIQRAWKKLRLQPIRVFCFHQVSEEYDPNIYCEPDWIPTAFLKDYIKQLQEEGFEFISLVDAYRHIKNDFVRTRKYAVLTADDGMICQVNLLPWLEERHIPITMFVDLETLDGRTCTKPVINYLKITDSQTEQRVAELLYLTKEKLMQLSSPMLTIGMHGVKHEPVLRMEKNEFGEQVKLCKQTLSAHAAFIPYFAYPYGNHSEQTDEVLMNENIIPVLADGVANYNDSTIIHREILEQIYKCQNHQS